MLYKGKEYTSYKGVNSLSNGTLVNRYENVSRSSVPFQRKISIFRAFIKTFCFDSKTHTHTLTLDRYCSRGTRLKKSFSKFKWFDPTTCLRTPKTGPISYQFEVFLNEYFDHHKKSAALILNYLFLSLSTCSFKLKEQFISEFFFLLNLNEPKMTSPNSLLLTVVSYITLKNIIKALCC